MSKQKVMVSVDNTSNVVTYEVEGDVAIGDKLAFPYGNWENERRRTGLVVALGAVAWTHPNGYTQPAYLGACKTAVVVERAKTGA